MKTETQQQQTQLEEFTFFVPEKAPDFCAVLDTKDKELIYLGKDKEKAERIIQAVNMHKELVKRIQILHNALKQSAEGYFDTETCRETTQLLNQAK